VSEFLNTSIEYLKGVGPARSELLKKELQVFTIGELLFHFPFRHIDRSKIYRISELNVELPYIQIKGKISNFRLLGKNRGQRLVANLSDGSGSVELIWFQGIKWVKDAIQPNKEYIVFGKPSEFQGMINIVHPSVDEPDDGTGKMYMKIMPVYSITEKMRSRGLDSKAIMKLQNAILTDSRFLVEENLPQQLTIKYKLPLRQQALVNIHFPSDNQALKLAESRLKFEELFFIQLKLLLYKNKRKTTSTGIILEKIGDYFNTFYNEKLPFSLTNAQKRVIKEIRADVRSSKQMNRLLQGDVGSGKTVVALMSMLMALDNSYQACLMAPTEILATQHFNGIKELLRNMNVNVGLLTGSTKQKERKVLLGELENGTMQILIGTHALIEEKVVFNNLGIAIIDEQHRFGVEQRSKIWLKNDKPPHILVMTATPIPRTMAMTLYGDLDLSVIDEMPAGRKPIKTVHKYDSNRLAVYGFLKEEIAKGRQIYIVYPLIEESEKLTYKNLIDGYENLCKEFPLPTYQVSIVHGKMKPADKEFEMQRFIKGQSNIMVATTVIEVGVNVPNATVMVIESSEKFGLAQLHQLRGRVGRGADQSYCILMSDFKLTKEAITRIRTMCETNDGFKISDIDLKLRGPGDMEGTAQSGVLDLKIANLAEDAKILQEAYISAEQILKEDPNLLKTENSGLSFFFKKYQKRSIWGHIS